MIPSTSSSYQKMMFCKKSFSLALTCLCCYRRKLPFLYFCYIFIGSDLGPPSAATRVYFFIFLQFICVLTLMSLVLYFVFMYHFCIIDSDASPAQIVFFSCQNRNEVGKQWKEILCQNKKKSLCQCRKNKQKDVQTFSGISFLLSFFAPLCNQTWPQYVKANLVPSSYSGNRLFGLHPPGLLFWLRYLLINLIYCKDTQFSTGLSMQYNIIIASSISRAKGKNPNAI